MSVFLTLTPPEHRASTEADHYARADAREAWHLAWLQGQLGPETPARAVFPWGVAGVGRDRSENVFLYLHYHGGARDV